MWKIMGRKNGTIFAFASLYYVRNSILVRRRWMAHHHEMRCSRSRETVTFTSKSIFECIPQSVAFKVLCWYRHPRIDFSLLQCIMCPRAHNSLSSSCILFLSHSLPKVEWKENKQRVTRCLDTPSEGQILLSIFLFLLTRFKRCILCFIHPLNYILRAKSLLELGVTTFLPDWQPPLIFCLIYLKLLVHVL